MLAARARAYNELLITSPIGVMARGVQARNTNGSRFFYHRYIELLYKLLVDKLPKSRNIEDAWQSSLQPLLGFRCH